METLRAATVLAAIIALTVPLMPVQAALLRFSNRGARRMPQWYHRILCRLLGLRLDVTGSVAERQPLLLVCNHCSWLDIPVLSALAPVSFVAKKEIGEWPGVAWLARLQRTIFVDRERRTSVGKTANEMLARLGQGDAVVLFPEGTSSDGNRVLPFRSPLFAAVKPGTAAVEGDKAGAAVVQTVSIVYKRMHGVDVGRADRHMVSWYGDMDLPSHIWQFLKSGPVDVVLHISEAVPLDRFSDRKMLARETEASIRHSVVKLLRGHALEEVVEVAEPVAGPTTPHRPGSSGGRWR
jgi:lyso-ornithine lipid O-acyltransferase